MNHLLIAGAIDGMISIFDMGPPGKERLTKMIDSFQGKAGIRLIAVRQSPRKEIITADAEGVVTVYDFAKRCPVYVLQAHSDIITQMEWNDEKQQLVTCGKD